MALGFAAILLSLGGSLEPLGFFQTALPADSNLTGLRGWGIGTLPSSLGDSNLHPGLRILVYSVIWGSIIIAFVFTATLKCQTKVSGKSGLGKTPQPHAGPRAPTSQICLQPSPPSLFKAHLHPPHEQPRFPHSPTTASHPASRGLCQAGCHLWSCSV